MLDSSHPNEPHPLLWGMRAAEGAPPIVHPGSVTVDGVTADHEVLCDRALTTVFAFLFYFKPNNYFSPIVTTNY